jgi:hypothetical protein
MMRMAVASLVVCGLSAVLVTPAAADAGAVSCGAVLTRDTVLTHDLECAGVGLGVFADSADVVLDLGGHTLRGDGSGAGIWTDGWYDGRATASSNRVTVRNGRVAGFATGIDVRGAPLSVERVRFDRAAPVRSGTAIGLLASKGARLRALEVQGFGTAVMLDASDGAHMVGSTLRNNDTGLWLAPTVLDITVDRTVISDGQEGLHVSQSAVTIRSSSIQRMQGPAVVLHQGEAVISDSVLADSGAGVDVPSDESGLDLRRTLVVGNGAGVHVGWTAPDYASLTYFQVHDNWFVANRGNGLAFGPWMSPATGYAPWAIRRNRFIGNGRNGVTIDARGRAEGNVTLAGNVAEWNGGQGIVASGVVDGGGNRARRNAVDPQCVGVRCT